MMRIPLRTRITLATVTAAALLAACAPVAIDDGTAPADGETGAVGAGERPVNEPVQEIADSVPAEIRDRGTLNVVMSSGMAPLNYPDASTGELIGFNPDIAHQLGEILDLEVELHEATGDQTIPGMQAGRYDISVNNQAVTDERLEAVDFVEYYFSSSYLGVQKGNPNDVSVDSLCGTTVGVSIGSYQQTVVLPELSDTCESEGEPALTIESFPDQQKAAMALTSGRIDAVSMDSPVLLYAAGQDDRIEPLEKMTEGSNVGITVTKGTGMLEPVQAAMQELIDNGNYEKTLAMYNMENVAVTEAAVHTE